MPPRGASDARDAGHRLAAQATREDAESESFRPPLADLYGQEIRAFADAVEQGHPFHASARDGVRSVAVTSAIVEAAETGRAVRVETEGDVPMRTETDRAVAAPALRAWGEAVLTQMGMSKDCAHEVIGNLLFAELRGVRTHGFLRLEIYVKRIQAGGIDPRAKPRIEIDAGAVCVVDCDDGPGACGGSYVARLAAERASRYGVAVVIGRNSNHFGVAGYSREPDGRRGGRWRAWPATAIRSCARQEAGGRSLALTRSLSRFLPPSGASVLYSTWRRARPPTASCSSPPKSARRFRRPGPSTLTACQRPTRMPRSAARCCRPPDRKALASRS